MKIVTALKALWLTVRSNPIFVAFEGGATGAVLNFIDNAIELHKLDFSRSGLQQLAKAAFFGGVIAVRLLYRPKPGSNPNS